MKNGNKVYLLFNKNIEENNETKERKIPKELEKEI